MSHKGFSKTIIIVTIAAVVVIFGGYFLFQRGRDTNVPVEGGKLIDITLKVQSPFSTATLNIKENGSVTYIAKQQGQEEIQDSGTLTTAQMSTLTKLIEEIDFIDMKSRAKSPSDPEDGSTYTISIRILPQGPPELADPGIHSVDCYQFSCENNFLKLKEKIIELWGKDILEVGV